MAWFSDFSGVTADVTSALFKFFRHDFINIPGAKESNKAETFNVADVKVTVLKWVNNESISKKEQAWPLLVLDLEFSLWSRFNIVTVVCKNVSLIGGKSSSQPPSQ